MLAFHTWTKKYVVTKGIYAIMGEIAGKYGILHSPRSFSEKPSDS